MAYDGQFAQKNLPELAAWWTAALGYSSRSSDGHLVAVELREFVCSLQCLMLLTAIRCHGTIGIALRASSSNTERCLKVLTFRVSKYSPSVVSYRVSLAGPATPTAILKANVNCHIFSAAVLTAIL